MKKVLGIISSPRKLGNCEVFIKEIFLNIPQEAQLELIRLSDFDLKPCRGCYMCLVNNAPCDINDDLSKIQKALIDCDAMIISTPTYFLGPNSMLKALLDRGLSLYSDGNKIWGKPAIGIGFAGIKDKDGYTELGIQNFLKAMISDVKYTGIIYSAFPGEVFVKDENKNLAKRMGEILFSDESIKRTNLCPVCGGDSFKFYPDQKIKCLLCSNTGKYSIVSGQIKFEISGDKHGLFLSENQATSHREWLLQMKNDFRKNIPTLKIIRDKYQDIGTWIKPEKK